MVGRLKGHGVVAAVLPGFGVADAYEDRVGPGLEPLRLAQLGQRTPDADERLLRRILGELRITQDPFGRTEEAVQDRIRDQRERSLIPPLCSCDEVGVHRPFPKRCAVCSALS